MCFRDVYGQLLRMAHQVVVVVLAFLELEVSQSIPCTGSDRISTVKVITCF